jgi:hypothetical protein
MAFAVRQNFILLKQPEQAIKYHSKPFQGSARPSCKTWCVQVIHVDLFRLQHIATWRTVADALPDRHWSPLYPSKNFLRMSEALVPSRLKSCRLHISRAASNFAMTDIMTLVGSSRRIYMWVLPMSRL